MSEEKETYEVKEADLLRSQKEALRLTILTAVAWLDLGRPEAAHDILEGALVNVW